MMCVLRMSGHIKPLWEGYSTPDACLNRCGASAFCRFATVEFFPKTRPGGGYCVLHRSCPAMTGWDNAPCTLPAPACMPQSACAVVTYQCHGCPPAPPAPPPVPFSGKYFLEAPFDITPGTFHLPNVRFRLFLLLKACHSRVIASYLVISCCLAMIPILCVCVCVCVRTDNSSYVTVIPYVGNTLVMGNEISNSTTLQIYGSGFNVIFAGNTLKQCVSRPRPHRSCRHPLIRQVFAEDALVCARCIACLSRRTASVARVSGFLVRFCANARLNTAIPVHNPDLD